ncbi:MAG: type II toxin-antitoxin system VapC family toxin [Thermoprotei archaeon]|nr:MAG: type II toxin-antitoxin system VapC family toxin [Thermoprotei archaeon]RLE98823.1 MAG: type II toxin-antitoxin system VapC family toxin [Thermoprotei archaeon]
MGRRRYKVKTKAKRVLIDTDVLIDIEKGFIEPPNAICFISIITLYEYIRGKADSAEAKELLEEAFSIVPLDNSVLLKASEIWRSLKRRGQLIDERDLLIGATAIVKNMPLATKNIKHYERLTVYGLNFATLSSEE